MVPPNPNHSVTLWLCEMERQTSHLQIMMFIFSRPPPQNSFPFMGRQQPQEACYPYPAWFLWATQVFQHSALDAHLEAR